MRFEYLEPTSIQEATSLLAKFDGKAKVIAGGTDLVVQMKRKLIRPQYIVNLAFIPGLEYINYDPKDGLKIGAMTTISALEKSSISQPGYSVISQAASKLGSMAIRNVATLGGNLCNAAPSAEMAPALIGLSAKAKIFGPKGERVVLLEDFFTGPGTTVLKTGELLTEIQVPVPSTHTEAVYLRHEIRGALDLAIVSVAAVIRLQPGDAVCQEAKVVLGAVAPTPLRAHRAEETIKGKTINEEFIEKVAQVAADEARPISDVRASADYRREMVKVYTKEVIRKVLDLAKSPKGGSR
jgi:CO/xanthine dehydrogenase FAD-binding subunit